MSQNWNFVMHSAIVIATLCLTAGFASVGIDRAAADSLAADGLGGRQLTAPFERYVGDLGELFDVMADGHMF